MEALIFHLFTKIDSISTSELEQKLKGKIQLLDVRRRRNIGLVISRVRRMSHSMKSQDIHRKQMRQSMSFVTLACGAKWQPKS